MGGDTKMLEMREDNAASVQAVKKWIEAHSKTHLDTATTCNKPIKVRLIRWCQTARETQTELKCTYQSKGPAKAVAFFNHLISLKAQGGDNTREYSQWIL